ncbi:hypothetical protein Btru_058168 [Bulinus truncatus]|nr:hypothetical protein Btru_058168 [Bulinus truncatus]
MLINSTMENDMKPLKKTFSAPNKIPNTNAKKLLKISKKDENIACCAESSKHNHKLGQNVSKQETRKPKSLTDKEYEEIFSNVIHALEIESFENSVNASKNENLPHNKNLTNAEKIDKIAVDTDSIDSEDIDEWDNLSNKQLLNLSSDLPNSKQEYKKKKNLKFGRLIKSNLQDYSTEPENCCSNELEEKDFANHRKILENEIIYEKHKYYNIRNEVNFNLGIAVYLEHED